MTIIEHAEPQLLNEILRNNTISYHMLGEIMELVSDQTSYGLSTVALFRGKTHYLGDEEPNVVSAIHVYESVNNMDLNEDQMAQITLDNYLISNPILDLAMFALKKTIDFLKRK